MKTYALAGSAAAFALGVLGLTPALATGGSAGTGTMGAKDVARATSAELAIVRRGPVTVAEYNTATDGQRACIGQAGATAVPYPHTDGRIDYGAIARGSSVNGAAVDRCFQLGRLVTETYVYDHLSVWSWSFPIPGLGPAVTRLRAS